jgi:potassium-dependent mechanosensitive channel
MHRYQSIRVPRVTILFAALAAVVGAQVLPKSILFPSPLPPPAQQAASPATTAPAPPPDLAIPLPQIADRAEELDRLLRDISKQLTATSDLIESDKQNKTQGDDIAERLRDVDKLLAGAPTSLELQEEDRFWRGLSTQYSNQRKILATRAASLQGRIQLLDAQQVQWQATLDQIKNSTGIEAVVDRINQKLDEMRRVRTQAQEQLNQVLTLQNHISQQDQQVSEVLLKLDAAKESLRGRLLEREVRPLWGSREQRQFDRPMGDVLQRALSREFSGGGDYVKAEWLRLLGLLVVYGLAFLAAINLKRSAGAWPEVPPQALAILHHPFSLALLAALLATLGRVSSAPVGVTFIVLLLYMIQVLRLLPPLIDPELVPFLRALAVFSILDGLHLAAQLTPVIKRELFALLILAALVVFAWLARPAKMRELRMPARFRSLFVAGIRAALILLAVSLIANILGFLSLSQTLGIGTLLGAFMAVVLYCVARILGLILAALLCSPWARLKIVNRVTVLLWSKRALNLGASLLWIDSVLFLFTVHEKVGASVSETLSHPLGFGTLRVTLGGVISLLLVVFVGYAVAKSLSYALQRVLLTRFSLQRGLPYAASKVVYYVLIILVFLAALANAGIELNKFTVITGALGVGVGFGLQNVVNNFASGLILLFERPIRVDDTVEVGGLVGTVRRIGARSSTIQTFQGAEVIVPNSNLIANQVVNWTLSSPWRRVDIPVGVAYGTDPEEIIKLLVNVATSHSGVMRSPEPTAFFLGFGDSALNFELRFWAARQEIWFQLKSDVSISVDRALREAGVEIPFPQRDLHVRSVDASVKENLPSPLVPPKPTA